MIRRSIPKAKAEGRKLKEAALIIMQHFEEEFSDLGEQEGEFAYCLQDVLMEIRHSTDSREDVRRSTYGYPLTLKSMARAMKLYGLLFHIVSSIEGWSRNDNPQRQG